MFELTEKDLENMKNHKYKTTGYSTLDNKMNPFWTYCANLLPYKYSPNMVTLTGSFCHLFGVFIIVFYDYTLSKELPNYVYFIFALMLFLGQTFDAIDGKHARNTNRSSSLGQLMDHGCDAMDNFTFCIMICQSHLLGPMISCFVEIGIQQNYYAYTLEENFTGVIRTNTNDFGVTEIQFLSMILCLFPIFDRHFLDYFEFFGTIKINILMFYITLIFSIVTNTYLIITDSNGLKDAWNKWNKMIPLCIFNFFEFLASRFIIFNKYAYFILILNGLYYTLFAAKLIICNMSKKKINNFDIDMIIYDALIGIGYLIKNEFLEKIIFCLLTLWLIYRFNVVIIGTIKKLLNYLKMSF